MTGGHVVHISPGGGREGLRGAIQADKRPGAALQQAPLREGQCHGTRHERVLRRRRRRRQQQRRAGAGETFQAAAEQDRLQDEQQQQQQQRGQSRDGDGQEGEGTAALPELGAAAGRREVPREVLPLLQPGGEVRPGPSVLALEGRPLQVPQVLVGAPSRLAVPRTPERSGARTRAALLLPPKERIPQPVSDGRLRRRRPRSGHLLPLGLQARALAKFALLQRHGQGTGIAPGSLAGSFLTSCVHFRRNRVRVLSAFFFRFAEKVHDSVISTRPLTKLQTSLTLNVTGARGLFIIQPVKAPHHLSAFYYYYALIRVVYPFGINYPLNLSTPPDGVFAFVASLNLYFSMMSL